MENFQKGGNWALGDKRIGRSVRFREIDDWEIIMIMIMILEEMEYCGNWEDGILEIERDGGFGDRRRWRIVLKGEKED